MKLYVLEKFDSKELKSFANFVNMYPDNEHIHIILNSTGGDTCVKESLIYLINGTSNKFSISVQKAFSNGFKFLLEVLCDVKLLDSCFAMHHKGKWATEISDGNKLLGEFANFQITELANFKEDNSFLTKEEKEIFDSGRDLFFNKDRLTQILIGSGKEYNKDLDIFNT